MIRTVDLLSDHPFLAGLPRPWLERLSSHGHPLVRHTGQRIFHEGMPAERFWLIRSGRVALDITDPRRGDIVIEHIGAGSVLGWSWLFPPYRWHFGAIAVEQTHTVEFDAPGVRRMIADDAELGRELTTRFLAVMADRLQATRLRLAELYALKPAE
jgi:CRP-like cAMP-binding protein